LWRGHPLTPPTEGDPIVTGGDLVFRGTKEGLVAIDANTGATLWKAALPVPPTGTPATYRTGGRQFVVVPAGDALVAFALPLEVIAKPVAVAPPPERFDAAIAQIETRLGKNPPAPGGIVFLGSSTFTQWNVTAAFPDLPVTNLGFGGSHITDVNHYVARLLLPLRPRLVVFYCGSNDVGANFSYDEIVARWRSFSEWMDSNLPETHVLVLSNLPTPRRWIIWPDMHGFNALLADEIANHPRRHYLDGTHIMLDPDGRLRVDRISSDILHMNATGNAAMGAALRPAIDAIWAEVRPR
jgi:lysophospholipase L1-like esterase